MKIDFSDFVFTGRGSAGLWAILKSLNKKNSKILVPVNICEIVIPIILKAGMCPVYYDVNEISGISDLSHIIDVYQGDEVALLAVHNFGMPLDIEKIGQWAKGKNIFLIEDVCNAIGAQYNGIQLGRWGDAAIFSFGYAKIIEYGVGGAFVVKDKYLQREVETKLSSLEYYSEIHKNEDRKIQSCLREYRKTEHLQVPSVYLPLYNKYTDYLLYNICKASIAEIKEKINNIEKNLRQRADKALLYRSKIRTSKVTHIDEIEGQIYWRYNLLVEPPVRSLLINELRKNKLLVSTWYPPVIGLFEEKFERQRFAGGFSFSKKVINLFLDHRVSDYDILETIKFINNF